MFKLGMGDSSIHRQVKPGEDAADWQAAPSGYHIGSTQGANSGSHQFDVVA